MKIIIPLAGKGTRLRPHTYAKPKPLVKVAGKAILGHILDKIKILNPEEVIFITGEMDDQIKDYVSRNYDFNTSYFNQIEQLGDGHAVFHAKEKIDSDVLIAFNDTLFEADLTQINNLDGDGMIWVSKVDDPSRFGIVTLGEGKVIKSIVEKPENPPSDLAIIGLYYFKDGVGLFDYLDKIIKENITSKGNEYRLADAMQQMLKDGKKLIAGDVKKWMDCGSPENLLETNHYLLDHGINKEIKMENSIVIPPVYIEDGAKIENSVIGPYVSIAAGAEVKKAIVKNTIIGENAIVEDAKLKASLIGDNACVVGMFKKLNLGDNSEIRFE